MKRDIKLIIPHIWEADWGEIAESYEGESAKLVQLAKDASTLLKKLDGDFPLTPEIAAWLILWVRQFAILHSSLAAVQKSSWLALEMLWRAQFELQLQVMTILDPTSPGVTNGSVDPESSNAICDRLCAYLAWCAWSDKKYHTEMTARWRIDQIWDDSLAREAQTNPTIRRLINALWGDEDLPTPEELRKGKTRHRAKAFKARNRAWQWLDLDRLSVWKQRLKDERPSGFYELIGLSRASLHGRLRGTPLEFAYVAYEYSSMLLHGSTIDGFLFADSESWIGPRLSTGMEQAESLAGHLRRFAKNTLVGLGLVQRVTIPD